MGSSFRRFLTELKRRRVTRVAVAYAAVGAAVAQTAQVVFEALRLPDVGWRAVVLLILLGFPVSLVLTWIFDWTAEGVRRTEAESELDSSAVRRAGWGSIVGWGLAGVLLFVTGWQALGESDAAAEALSAVANVEDAMDRSDWISAYRSAQALPTDVPDSARRALRASVSSPKTLVSDPPGAHVSWRPYADPAAPWEPIGTTPLDWEAPRAAVALRFEVGGYTPRIVAMGLEPWLPNVPIDTRLRRVDELYPDALHMPGGAASPGLSDGRLNQAPPLSMDEYLIDKFEVTNRQYQAFVDAGGYARRELWKHPFIEDGRVLGWEAGIAKLVDSTGDPGPSTWAEATFPEGQGTYPVAGLSWYEAAAYAEFENRELPTLYHWYQTAHALAAEWVVPFSNFSHQGPAPVGANLGVSPAGAYDMAGNAREWVANATGDLRYTVGGGWDDRPDLFTLAQPQSPFDRSQTNGLRLMTHLGTTAKLVAASAPVDRMSRDFVAESPVAEDIFVALRDQYRIDDVPLDADVESSDTVRMGIWEKVTFEAGYGGTRMILHVIRPTVVTHPLQTVLYMPSRSVTSVPDLETFLASDSYVSFLVRSGRAVAVPAYEGTLERRDGFIYDQSVSNEYRDHVMHSVQDLRRSLDYLQSRPDIDRRGFSFLGVSWGGKLAPIVLAVEPRFQAAVLVSPGLWSPPVQPVVDPFNFLPHVVTPVEVLSGRYDQVYPLETSALPFYELLGTREPEKKHYVAQGGHDVPLIDATQETLAWLDRYLGPAK